MYACYVSENGRIVQSDAYRPNSLIMIVAPTEDEIKRYSEEFDIPASKLSAVTDIEEPSRVDSDEKGMYIIVDIPYKNEEGNFETVPLSIIIQENRIIAVCEKHTGLIRRFIEQTSKGLNLEDKMDFAIRILYAVTKEYQQDLHEIDMKRRDVEKKIHTKTEDSDIITLHDLENSLVYFITSLKGCNLVLSLMKRNSSEKMTKPTKDLFKTVGIENQQAIEMAMIYREILGSTRDLLGTEINLKLNHTMKWLTAVTIVLTIPMIITGAYGMNVTLPIQESRYAFSVIFIGTAILCGAIGALLWKKKIL